MAWLKGQEIGGYVNISKKVKFTDAVIATRLNTLPWSDIFYVDPIAGVDTNDGLSPTKAFLTLTKALTLAGRQDVIYIRPNAFGSDTSDPGWITEAASMTVPFASYGLSIIGVTPSVFGKPYSNVPFFRYGEGESDTGYVLKNNAPALNLENLGFQTGGYIRASYGAVNLYSSTTGGAYTTHGGSNACTINHCFFRDGQLNINGGYDTAINDCTFEASGSANTGVWSTDNGLPNDGLRITNCFFNEMFGNNQPLRYIYFVAGQHYNFYVNGCRFGLVPDDNHYMWFGAYSKGLVDKCFFQHAGVSIGANDTDDELYSNDGGVIFASIYDTSTGVVA